jgi:hypothetical protein
MKDPRVVRSVRLPTSLIATVQRHADDLGLTFNDVVIEALNKELGTDPDARSALLAEVSGLLNTVYREDFTPDLIRRVFLDIRNTPHVFQLYDRAVRNAEGEPDDEHRAAIHRSIGRLIRVVLPVRVVGRERSTDDDELIDSYAVLEWAG